MAEDDMLKAPPPIYATPPPDLSRLPPVPPARKKPGPKPRMNPSDPTTYPVHRGRPRTPAAASRPGCCPNCGNEVTALTLESTKELVRWSRDRFLDTPPEESTKASTDLLYLAARLDGYCSLVCWRQSVAQEILAER